ncbi:hypothetical protein TWF730_002966 [Orbilia blumenaviensis]|uniref:Uncharacterized protein n=1 Tax=Orbilia blumenaviensis TaxID=1796055 RepID=A0AAV9UAB0_9PEZI
MVSKLFVLALGAVPSVSAAVLGRQVCNADNCLRAFRATQFPTRLPQASADCQRILWETVIPPAQTITEYSTISTTEIVTVPTTLVETFYAVQTEIIPVTEIEVTSTVITRVIEIASSPQKRTVRAPDPSTSFPAYATPCSGIVRFSSACSCIGVVQKTITAPAPLKTVTLPTTRWETAHTTKTVKTESITFITSTTTIYTTVATTTSTVESFVDIPVTTATPKIQEGTVSSYLGKSFIFSGSTILIRTSVATQATKIYIDGYGHMWVYVNGVAKVAKVKPTISSFESAPEFLEFIETWAPSANGKVYLKCRIDAQFYLRCTAAGVELAWLEVETSSGLRIFNKEYTSDSPDSRDIRLYDVST